jgi:hypothetical protein
MIREHKAHALFATECIGKVERAPICAFVSTNIHNTEYKSAGFYLSHD